MRFKEAFQAAGGEKEEAAKPLRTVKIEPGDFSDTWKSKPKSAIVAGLRLLSSEDEETAKEQSIQAATEAPEALASEAYNSRLKSYAVALALCDPNDVTRAHPAFPMAEDSVPEALTSRCLTRLFDELERLQVEASPIFGEATDDKIRMLIAALATDEPLAGFPPVAERRIRRYLNFVLSELIEFTEPIDE